MNRRRISVGLIAVVATVGCIAAGGVAAGQAAHSVKHSKHHYRTISLARLFGQRTRTVQMGSTLYRYSWTGAVGGKGDPYIADKAPFFKANHTSCKSFTLNGGAKNDHVVDNQGSALPEIQAVREGRGEYNRMVPTGKVKDFAPIKLTPGRAVQIKILGTFRPTGDESWAASRIYLNGSAECWTTNGRVPKS